MARTTETRRLLEQELGKDAAFGVTVVLSPDAGSVGRQLRLEGALGVGRDAGPGISLRLEDPDVSRRHATLQQRGALPFFDIHDHESTNGTFVNGARVQAAALDERAVLRMGGTLLVVGPWDPVPEGFETDAEILGRTGAVRRLVETVARVAPTPLDVLVLGETGTGKELVARRLHQRSGRKGPLLAVNCGAIPETLIEAQLFGHRRGAFTGATSDGAGLFEAADGGTLFLDEIGELPPALQPKLLRVLESREFIPVGETTVRRCDVRVVAATNASLADAVAQGTFRRDLLARLEGYVVEMPPLRERLEDVLLLARHFLERLEPPRTFEIGVDFAEALLCHDWPMNVRELRSALRRLTVLPPEVTTLRREHLPRWESEPRPAAEASAATLPPPPRTEPTRAELEEALRHYGGRVADLARFFGKQRAQVYRWLRKHDLDPEAFRIS